MCDGRFDITQIGSNRYKLSVVDYLPGGLSVTRDCERHDRAEARLLLACQQMSW